MSVLKTNGMVNQVAFSQLKQNRLKTCSAKPSSITSANRMDIWLCSMLILQNYLNNSYIASAVLSNQMNRNRMKRMRSKTYVSNWKQREKHKHTYTHSPSKNESQEENFFHCHSGVSNSLSLKQYVFIDVVVLFLSLCRYLIDRYTNPNQTEPNHAVTEPMTVS